MVQTPMPDSPPSRLSSEGPQTLMPHYVHAAPLRYNALLFEGLAAADSCVRSRTRVSDFGGTMLAHEPGDYSQVLA